MRRVLAVSALLVFGLLGAAKPIVIGITQIVEHRALNAVRQGIIDFLASAGYKEGENVVYVIAIAQGDPAVAALIARDFKDRNVDLVISISTPSSEAVTQVFAGTNTPVVFSAVTAPAQYNLVGHPNITGVSDLIDPPLDLALLKIAKPSIKKVGIVYNPGEANSAYLTEVAKAAAPAFGLEIITAPAESTAMLLMAAQSLVGRVDAIYCTTDNTVAAGIESIVQIANTARIPFLMADPESRFAGPVLCAGWNYYSHGLLTGKLVLEILAGKKPSDIPIIYQKDSEFNKREVWLNMDALATQPVELTDALLAEVTGVLIRGFEFVKVSK